MKQLLALYLCSLSSITANPSYWLIGNYAPVEVKEQTPALIPWNMYTVVNDFAIAPTRTCALDDRLVRAQIVDFVSAAHANGKSALITLKDGDPGIFFNCTNAANIRPFVNRIVAFVTSNNYDGIDLDWEQIPNFSGTYIARYDGLISRLRAKLPGKILTISVYANAPGHALERITTTSQGKLDRVSVMCYDMDGVGNGDPKSWYVDALRQAGD